MGGLRSKSFGIEALDELRLWSAAPLTPPPQPKIQNPELSIFVIKPYGDLSLLGSGPSGQQLQLRSQDLVRLLRAVIYGSLKFG